MHAGHYIAYNIHQTLISQQQSSHSPKFMELVPVPPMIGLAVGKKAVAYGPTEGVSSGEDVMYAFFKHDLGFESKLLKICPPQLFFFSFLTVSVQSAGTGCSSAAPRNSRRFRK
jgi:hypothetical protein